MRGKRLMAKMDSFIEYLPMSMKQKNQTNVNIDERRYKFIYGSKNCKV